MGYIDREGHHIAAAHLFLRCRTRSATPKQLSFERWRELHPCLRLLAMASSSALVFSLRALDFTLLGDIYSLTKQVCHDYYNLHPQKVCI
jgi:hypothetical protein